MFKKLNRNYVSQIDKFLQQFDKKHPQPSQSQRLEIKKHERIAQLRDDASSSRERAK